MFCVRQVTGDWAEREVTWCQVISVCPVSCCPSGVSGDPYWFSLLFWNLASGNKRETFTGHVGCARRVENLRHLSFSPVDTIDTGKEQMIKETLVFVCSLRQGWSL